MSEYSCDSCGTEAPEGQGYYTNDGQRLCIDCYISTQGPVTPVTDTTVWADDLWDNAITAMNDLHDWFATTGQKPGAPVALSHLALSISHAAKDVANLRQAWNDYVAHVGTSTAHRVTQAEMATINANLRGL